MSQLIGTRKRSTTCINLFLNWYLSIFKEYYCHPSRQLSTHVMIEYYNTKLCLTFRLWSLFISSTMASQPPLAQKRPGFHPHSTEAPQNVHLHYLAYLVRYQAAQLQHQISELSDAWSSLRHSSRPYTDVTCPFQPAQVTILSSTYQTEKDPNGAIMQLRTVLMVMMYTHHGPKHIHIAGTLPHRIFFKVFL